MCCLLINLLINNLITLLASKVGSLVELVVTSALLCFKWIPDPWFKQPYNYCLISLKPTFFSLFQKVTVALCLHHLTVRNKLCVLVDIEGLLDIKLSLQIDCRKLVSPLQLRQLDRLLKSDIFCLYKF